MTLTIFSAGAFYELIEMWVAMIVAPDLGAKFIGLQGDEWDTQHDMELALYGSLLSMMFAAMMRWMRRAKSSENKANEKANLQ